MTLNEFLAKASSLFGFAEKVEKHFEASDKFTSRIAELETQLATSQEQAKNLQAENDKLKADAKAASEKFTKDLADKEAEVEKRASDKALQIVAAQGATAVKDTKQQDAQAGGETIESLQKQMQAETDPAKKYNLAKKAQELRKNQ